MANRALAVSLAVSLVLMAGCTAVQKGSAAGGAIGGATGAAVGHYMTGAGGVTGGVVGLGLGATAGAIAAEHYYGGAEDAEAEELSATVDQLSAELAEKDRALQERQAALEKEKAQQKALLEAYDKARKGGSKTLQASAPANVEVTEGDNTITYTILSEVLFDSGRAELTASGKSALHEAARAIRRDYPDAYIEVRGHTDNVPIRYSSYKSNWHLSCARAVAVVQHLIEAEGFEPKRLAATGCGEARPVASNSSATGRRRNRRAELVVRPEAVKVAEVRVSD